MEKRPCLAFKDELDDFGHFGPNFGQFWPKLTEFDPLDQKFQNFIKKSHSGLCKKRKSGLIWLSRPLNTYLAIWANFGPIWANISQRGWGTPTFFWSPRLYLPIGT